MFGNLRVLSQELDIKGRIRDVAAQRGSVEASIAQHPDLDLHR